MKLIRTLITYGLFPIVFIGALGVTWWGLKQEIEPGYVLSGITLATVLITLVFERIHPKHKRWNLSHGDVPTDLLHGLISMILLPQALEALLKAGLVVLAIKLTEGLGFSLWPESWPIFIQLILAMLISQFGEYWTHRGMHEIPFLWRFHSIHHSPKRLYWLNAARFHPLDTAASFTVALVPLLILGVPDEILVYFTAWVAVHGLFQHCNIDIKLGPLNYIFSLAELHRWHHSLKLEEANSNYGNNIIFWDLVFGTMYYPKDKEASEHIGLHEMDEFPEAYHKQIAAPFQWKKINQQQKK